MSFFNILFLRTSHVHKPNALPYPVLLCDVWPPSFIIFPHLYSKSHINLNLLFSITTPSIHCCWCHYVPSSTIPCCFPIVRLEPSMRCCVSSHILSMLLLYILSRDFVQSHHTVHTISRIPILLLVLSSLPFPCCDHLFFHVYHRCCLFWYRLHLSHSLYSTSWF